MPEFDANELRLALRRLAKAVTVITTIADGARHAMAATAVSELSLEPSSMLICVNRTASLFPILRAGAPFAVNILHSSHAPIVTNCSGPVKGEARFEMGDWIAGAMGVPCLLDAQAAIVCSNQKMVEHGTHGIFIGDVVEIRMTEVIDPLVYMDGRFGRAQLADNGDA